MASGETRITVDEPLDGMNLSELEIKRLVSLGKADTGASTSNTSNKPILIQEVTQILRTCYSEEECERFFKPTSVVIGPLNHQIKNKGDLRIKKGEECKQKLAKEFFEFSNGSKEDFYKNVKKNINSLKTFYNLTDEQKLNDEELAWMFLVDGCALLQFIALDVIDAWEEFSVDNDLVSIMKVDFFLLENQLPYQLLEILLNSFAEPSSEELTGINLKELFNKFIIKFINKSVFSLTGQQQHQIQGDISPPHPLHLLDLLRRRLIGKRHDKQMGIDKFGFLKKVRDFDKIIIKHCPSIRKVKEMKDKGIRFKAREKGGGITDVEFKDRCCMATVTLAPIFLHNTTVPLLLNLIAYELCPDFRENSDITSHLSFLDFLIDNEEDVKELRDAGVLHNELGSDEAAAELFNKISNILVSNLEVHSKLKRRIREYCNSKKSHLGSLRASVEGKLAYTYFRSPWMLFVFLAALAGLIMTGMQTYFGFRHY